MGALDGRSVLVTGAARGIGAADRRGGRRRGRRASRCSTSILRAPTPPRALGGDAHFFACDVRSLAEVERAVAEAEEALGGLDGLVNNAGINAYFDAVAMTEERVGLRLRRRPQGRMDAREGGAARADRAPRRDREHQLDPGAADGARVLPVRGGESGPRRAHPLARTRIRVRRCPRQRGRARLHRHAPRRRSGSACRTIRRRRSRAVLANIPLGRMAEPREIGDAVVFLLSDQASAITGETLAVDCGTGARFAT